MEYEIKYLNSDEACPVKVLQHVDSLLYLRAVEALKDEVSWLILFLTSKLGLDPLQVETLHCSALTQRDRVCKLFEIIRSQESLTPGTIEKAVNVLLNLSGNENLSSSIRRCILNEFEEKVEIKPRFKWMETIPATPAYYIPRTVSSKARLDGAFLKEVTSDVLLFSGIGRNELSTLLEGKMVVMSSTQTRSVRDQYIVLETENHFSRICSITSKNVHWIRREGDNFYWVRSRGDVQLLQNHIHTEQEKFGEEDFVDQLEATGTMPVCIADSPGMGKTVLLASMARMVQDRFPEKHVFFFVLRELIPQLEEEKEKAVQWTDQDQLLSILTSCVQMKTKNNWDERALVKRALQTEMEAYQFELFFDGFDETLSGQVAICKRLIQSLLKVPNCRIHVTTRLHMLEQLESTLGVLGYNILPLNLEEQKTFLRQYWITKHQACDTHQLLKFALQCLESIKSNLNDAGQDIAGIPLQCYMIAEVFCEDAKEYAEGKTKTEKWILVESIFDLYQKLFDEKFRRAQEVMKLNGPQEVEFLKEYCVLKAFQLLFPDFTGIFDMVSPATLKLTEEGINKVYSAGLMEPVPGSDTPRFVHRTFAECLIAEHVVKSLPNRDYDASSDSRSTSFLFQNIFSTLQNRTYEVDFFAGQPTMRIKGPRFQYPVINYFIDWYLNDTIDAIQYDQMDEQIQFISPDILIPCAVNNFLSTFEFISRTMRWFHAPQPNPSDLRFISAACCTNWKMVEKVVQFSGIALHLVAEARGLKFTPLHAAVRRGAYTVSKYLLELCKSNLPPGLLHCCLGGSGRDSASVINKKMEVIDLIVSVDRSTLEQVWYGEAPIHCWEASPILVQHLITLGAKVNTLNTSGQTVLHTIDYSKMTLAFFSQFCELLRSNGFEFWGEAVIAELNWTPLHHAVQYVDVDRATLAYFRDADFNANTVDGKSVLYFAVSHKRNYDCIKLLCEFGADIWGHECGMTLCYYAAKFHNYDALVYLTERDDCRRPINDTNPSNGNTALHEAAVIGFYEGVKILIESGADMYAKNEEGDIPLISALKKGERNFNINVFREMEKKGFRTEEYIPEILHLLIMTRNDEEPVPGDDIRELALRCLEAVGGGSSLTQTFSEPTKVTIDALADYIDAFKRGQVEPSLFPVLQKLLEDFLAGRTYPTLPRGVINFTNPMNMTRSLFVKTFDPDLCHKRIREFLSNSDQTSENLSYLAPILTFQLSMSDKIDELKQKWTSQSQIGNKKVIIIGSDISEEIRALLGGHETVTDALGWNDLPSTLQYKLLWQILTPTHPNFKLCQISSLNFCKSLKDLQLSKLLSSSFNQQVDLSTHLSKFMTDLVSEMDAKSLERLESISFRQFFPDETKKGSAVSLQKNKLSECVAWYFVARKLLRSKNEGEPRTSSVAFTLDDFITQIQTRTNECDCATFLHYPYDLISFYFDWFGSKSEFITQIQSIYLSPAFFESTVKHRAQNLISLASDPTILSKLEQNQIMLLLETLLNAEQQNDMTIAEETVFRELAKVRNADVLEAFQLLIFSRDDPLKQLHPRRRLVLSECVLVTGEDPVILAKNILEDETIPVTQLIEFVKYLAARRLTPALYTGVGTHPTAFHRILKLTPIDHVNAELFQALRDEAGFDFDVLDENIRNLLHYAIWYRKNVEVIQALVKCGTDYYQADSYGNTLIHELVRSSLGNGYGDYESVLHYLIGLGIDANAKNTSGWTPLDLLEAHSEPRGGKEVIRRILESAIAEQRDNLE